MALYLEWCSPLLFNGSNAMQAIDHISVTINCKHSVMLTPSMSPVLHAKLARKASLLTAVPPPAQKNNTRTPPPLVCKTPPDTRPGVVVDISAHGLISLLPPGQLPALVLLYRNVDRMSTMGYLAHPAFGTEPGGTVGNYGLLDHVAAL